MNELEDFFHSAAKAHVTAAAMHYFDMHEKTEKLTKHAWPPPFIYDTVYSTTSAVPVYHER